MREGGKEKRGKKWQWDKIQAAESLQVGEVILFQKCGTWQHVPSYIYSVIWKWGHNALVAVWEWCPNVWWWYGNGMGMMPASSSVGTQKGLIDSTQEVTEEVWGVMWRSVDTWPCTSPSKQKWSLHLHPFYCLYIFECSTFLLPLQSCCLLLTRTGQHTCGLLHYLLWWSGL